MDASSTNFTITELDPNTSYFVRVTAKNADDARGLMAIHGQKSIRSTTLGVQLIYRKKKEA